MKRFFRSVFALVLVCCTLLTIPITAAADNGTVTYDGKAREFKFKPGSIYSETDLFPNFKNVMPGDTLTQQIVINNTGLTSKHIKVYLRSLGATENEAFLNQMELTVTKSGKDTVYFKAPADETAQLTDWKLLGTIYKGGKITLDLTLKVPIEMGNDFQQNIGKLDWEFKVDEIPHDPDAPKTGDTSHIYLLITIMVVCLVALIVLFAVYRKKRKNRK